MPALDAQIELTSEWVGASTNGAVHRVYAHLPEGASVLSMYADGENAFSMEAPGGVYQSDNEAILMSSDQMMNEDSWFTIGEPDGNNNLQETGGADWSNALDDFASGQGFICDDSFGGAFYLLPGSSQMLSTGGVVLIGQFVSPDTVSLTLNLQWKGSPGASSTYSEGLNIELLPQGLGCTDSSALNFDSMATIDNGSCEWPIGSFDGLEFELHSPATESLPPTYRIYAKVLNPNEGVTSWYGTAESPLQLTSTTVIYQSEESAFTYPGELGDSTVLQTDSWVALGGLSPLIVAGLSQDEFESGGDLVSDSIFGGAVAAMPGIGAAYPDADQRVLLAQVSSMGTIGLAGNITLSLEGGGSASMTDVSLTIPGATLGCTDPVACNYDANADAEDDSCDYTDVLGICGGGCTADVDGDGVCDDSEIEGCTDEQASNYSPMATEDDGSCDYAPIDEDSTGFVGLHQELVATGPNDLAVHRVYAEFEGPGYELISMFGTEEDPMSFSADSGFYQAPDGGPLAINLPASPSETSALDTWLTIGGDAAGSVNLLTVGVDFDAFEAGGDLLVDSPNGGALFLIPDSEPLAMSDSTGRVLIAQLASTASIDIQLNLKFKRPDGSSPEVLGVVLEVPPSMPGCTDTTACNYDMSAQEDDGSCLYPLEDYLDCQEVCLSDTDADGLCDEQEYEGCTDTLACNFDSLVDLPNSVADSCQYPVDVFGVSYVNCLGECFTDEDNDGVCDQDEVEGCTYSNACNYTGLATEEDGSCTFAAPGRDCDGGCIFDFNGDGVCDVPGTGGCTYLEAYNYQPDAPYDDGSCEFPEDECRFDSNGDGGVNISDLLDLLVAFGTDCPSPID